MSFRFAELGAAAAQSMIPTKQVLQVLLEEVIPELNGKLNGLAVRVPVANVSLLDFTFNTEKDFYGGRAQYCP